MAISGTGTGPFTITGTETTLSIYNFVVAANAANARKNAASTQFTFLCVLNVGNGSTTTSWSLTEQQIEITATSFTIAVAATMQLGIAGGPRSGCYLRVNATGFLVNGWIINGTFRAFASRVYSAGRVRANTGAIAYHEDCSLSYLESIDNNSGSQNPAITYIRCTQAGGFGGVALKLCGTMVIDSPRIYNATYAFQPLLTSSLAATYTVKNYVGVNNSNDITPNAVGTTVTNFIGAYDTSGAPRATLIVTTPGAGAVVRLQWTYDLACSANGTAAASANVRIRNAGGIDVLTTTTSAAGKITQQTITRVDYTGSAFGIDRYPYSIKSRKFNLSSEELTWQCDNHTTDKIAHAIKAFAPVSSAAGLAISNIEITQVSKENAITNSTFSSDTAWTKGSGVTISGGVANCSNSAAILAQNCSLIVGQTYVLSLAYTKTAGLALRLSSGIVDNTNVLYSSAALANGSGTLTVTFVAARDGIVLGASGELFSGTIDNFTCTRTVGLVTTTASRTVLDLWQYHCAFIAQTSSFDINDVWNYDGSILNIGLWSAAITGGTLTGATLAALQITVSVGASVSAGLAGEVINAGTLSGIITGNVTNTGTLASGATITGNVTQDTPTSMTGVAITGNLTYNTNTPITITFTNSTITGTVSNSGTGLVTILLSNSTIGTVGSNVTTQLVTALSITSLLADSQIYVSDNTGAQVAYVSSSGTSYTLDTTGGTGTWEWRVRKYGYEDQSGTFTPATSSESVIGAYLTDAFVVDTLVNVTAYTDLQTTQKIYDYSRYFATTNTGIALPAQFDKGFGMLTANSALTLNPSAVALMVVSGGVTTKTSGLAENVTVVVTGNFTQGSATLSNDVRIRATNLDSELLFSGIDSVTIYATQSDALTNTNPGATSTTGIIRFLYGAALSGVTMSGTVYLRMTLGTAIQVQSLVLALGVNEVDLSTTTLLQSVNTKIDALPAETLAEFLPDLQIINTGVQKSSLLVPHTTNL